jgi:hypothetical protein
VSEDPGQSPLQLVGFVGSSRAPKKSHAGLVIAGLIGLVGIAGLTLGAVTYNNHASTDAAVASGGGTMTQTAMCQTIATDSTGNSPDPIPTMSGGPQDLSSMQAAEVQVYRWASQTEPSTLKSELEQENTDAEQFISDFNADPQDDVIVPTGVLSLDISTFTIDQTKIDATCGININGSAGLSV